MRYENKQLVAHDPQGREVLVFILDDQAKLTESDEIEGPQNRKYRTKEEITNDKLAKLMRGEDA